jgi:hypothetical protein
MGFNDSNDSEVSLPTIPLLSKAVLSKIGEVIPRLSKAGMPSHSEGWGGLFKDDSTD